MPIFEFACRACGHRFEAAVSTSGTKKLSLTSAQKKNAGTTRDKAWSDYEYDRKHRSE